MSNSARATVCAPPPVLYCDSISCPDGYSPIDNAEDVECEGDSCEVTECCGERNQNCTGTKSDRV